MTKTTRAALYARVSTTDQAPENQLAALRAFAAARGWQTVEHVDHGISGAKERRPALDAMMAAARKRKVDVIACVRLDRLARSTHHLLTMARELEALGVDLVATDQAVDTTTPAGRLLFTVLGAIAEFERDLIRDRVMPGSSAPDGAGRRAGGLSVARASIRSMATMRGVFYRRASHFGRSRVNSACIRSMCGARWPPRDLTEGDHSRHEQTPTEDR
jgi:DNA invertase Pin-like site-specific DNA recombinase